MAVYHNSAPAGILSQRDGSHNVTGASLSSLQPWGVPSSSPYTHGFNLSTSTLGMGCFAFLRVKKKLYIYAEGGCKIEHLSPAFPFFLLYLGLPPGSRPCAPYWGCQARACCSSQSSRAVQKRLPPVLMPGGKEPQL